MNIYGQTKLNRIETQMECSIYDLYIENIWKFRLNFDSRFDLQVCRRFFSCRSERCLLRMVWFANRCVYSLNIYNKQTNKQTTYMRVVRQSKNVYTIHIYYVQFWVLSNNMWNFHFIYHHHPSCFKIIKCKNTGFHVDFPFFSRCKSVKITFLRL